MRAAALLLCALLAACADGYPSEDAPRLDEYAAEPPQLLQSLNAVGARRHLDARYRYALQPGCQLQVVADGGRPVLLPLRGAEIRARSIKDENRYDVLLLPEHAAGAQPVRVLGGGQWLDWVQARSLLAHLQRHCAQEAGVRSPSGSGPG